MLRDKVMAAHQRRCHVWVARFYPDPVAECGDPGHELSTLLGAGYVEQTNSLISELSVAEMLMYTTELKRDRQEPLKVCAPDGTISQMPRHRRTVMGLSWAGRLLVPSSRAVFPDILTQLIHRGLAGLHVERFPVTVFNREQPIAVR